MASLNDSLPPPHELVGLLPVKLTNSNYNTWKSLFLPILRRYHVLDLLDGSSICPPQFLFVNDPSEKQISNPEFQKWIDRDGSLLIWLNSTISDSILPHVCESKSPRDLWINLVNRFRTLSVCDNYQVIVVSEEEEPTTPAYSHVSSSTTNYSTSKNNKNKRRLSDCVKVAVMVRPLIDKELLLGCVDCVSVVPGGENEPPQVEIGSKSFVFDHVYKITAPATSCSIFDDCVAPLVEDLFHGCNSTVLAYGQSGSGKTYTMGTNYSGDTNGGGIIPKVIDAIFAKVKETKETHKYLIRISFVEILKEKVFDLLRSNSSVSRSPLKIRETANGGIKLEGVTEKKVGTKAKMATCLHMGSKARATGSTNMNSQSIRSHAIFTISLEQSRITRVTKDDAGDNILSAKLHLVDLAGSERVKRTGTDGLRLKEGIHLNRGLLSLGKVIRSLGEKTKKEGGHVPYRDSKLTRMLQDSLGVNGKTVMIACVSPANINADITLNTLEYANRARIIQNKAFVRMSTAQSSAERKRNISVNSSDPVMLESVETTFIQEYLACLNTASKEQLMELKGIGKRRADHIVALREASPIKSLSDLEDMGLSSKQVNDIIGSTARGLFD
ncbi:hypothetical protein MKW98_030372 [Papaver atlanticum]|uniref:Kinesin-like protein n=1 Tax=Papaver atlanticum TaxID=357466 RepID=A0AAD4XXU7_9MAGN|nr:hypothetical protein MKW98_030372 [Papaver atlanticum]